MRLFTKKGKLTKTGMKLMGESDCNIKNYTRWVFDYSQEKQKKLIDLQSKINDLQESN